MFFNRSVGLMLGAGACILLSLVGSLLIIVGTATVYDLDYDDAVKSPKNFRMMGFVSCFQLASKTYGDPMSKDWAQYGRYNTIYSSLLSRCIAGRASIYFFLLFSGIFTLCTMVMSMIGLALENKRMVFMIPFVATFTLGTLFAAGMVWVLASAELVASFMDCSSMGKDEYAAIAKVPGQPLSCMKSPTFDFTVVDLDDYAAKNFVSRASAIYAGLAISYIAMLILIEVVGYAYTTHLCADAKPHQQGGAAPGLLPYGYQSGPSNAPLLMS